MLIAIEGIDGSGKATQTKLLALRLRREGKRVRIIAFPRHGHAAAWAVGQYLRGRYGSLEDVSPEQMTLLFALDRFDAKRTIVKWLGQGRVVIADRYLASNLAHAGSKLATARRQKFWKWNIALEYQLLGIPKPTLTIILIVPSLISHRLIRDRSRATTRAKDIHERDSKHLEDTREIYFQLARMLPHTILIDCAPHGTLLPKQEIHEKIWAVVCSNPSSALKSTSA